MKFKQKSFRKIPDSLSQFGKDFLLGVKLSVLEDKQIEKIADKLSWEDGDSFLPNKIGRFSKRNADGTEIIRKDLPKEKVTRSFWTTRSQFDGRDSRTTVSDFVTRTYERYPRKTIPAQNIPTLCIENNKKLYFFIKIYPTDSDELFIHKVNLALEVFGSELDIHIPAKDGFVALPVKMRFVNWIILPKGTKLEMEEAIRQSLSPKLKPSIRPVIEKRMSEIHNFGPDEVVLGFGGYKGYVVYNFPSKGISVLESDNPNNATYVFEHSKWKDLSKLSKTEILANHLFKERIIHDQSWKVQVNKLLA